ncbi:3116_t:CDS:2, partial [Funneliformis mosseae]
NRIISAQRIVNALRLKFPGLTIKPGKFTNRYPRGRPFQITTTKAPSNQRDIMLIIGISLTMSMTRTFTNLLIWFLGDVESISRFISK